MNEPTAEIIKWAEQTVVFAMNIRAADLGKSTDDDAHMRFAAGEARRLVQQWWKDAWPTTPGRRRKASRDEAPQPIETQKLVMVLVRKTLYWSRDHLS